MRSLLVSKSQKVESTLNDSKKLISQRMAELNIEKKLRQKSTEELKTIAFKLLTMTAIEIRSCSRNQDDSPFVLNVILELSNGIHNLPMLIENVRESTNDPHPYYQKMALRNIVLKR